MPKHPNILWIQTDEQRPDSLGCYGSSWAKTPNLDALAQRGTLFRNCVCQSPVCVPSRISQLSARYPQETNVLMNQVHYCEDVLPRDLVTFPEVFAHAGYRTASIGKWHTPVHPTWQENEHIENLHEYAGFFDLNENYDEDAHEVLKRPGGTPIILAGRYPVADGNPSQLITDKGIDFLGRHDRSQPFLLRVSHLWPHTPVLCPPPWDKLYDPDELPIRYFDEEAYATRSARDRLFADTHRMRELPKEKIRQMWAQYMGLCAYVDHEVGRLLTALEEQGLAENTIVVYSADHGKALGEWGAGEKGCFDTEVWRVPFIWSSPGHIPQGRIDNDPCELLDTGETLLQLAGLTDLRPENWRGRDLFKHPAPEAVFGEIGWGSADCPLFDRLAGQERFKRPEPGRPYSDTLRLGVRTSRYRMDVTWLQHGDVTPPEARDGNLFDLENDPDETRNLYNNPACRQTVALHTGMLDAWWEEMDKPRDLFGST